MLPSLLDQALSSLSNFGVSVIAARSLDAHSFGIFALCYSGYLTLLVLVHGLVAEPFMMKMAAEPRQRVRREAGASVRSTALAGVMLGAPLVLGGLVAGGEGGRAAAVLGVGLPVLFVFEVHRWVAFTERRPWVAAAADGAWLVALVGGVIVLRALGGPPDTVGTTLAVWIGGCFVGLVVFLYQLGFPHRPRRPWFLRHRELGVPVAAELVVDRGSRFLSNVVVGGVISVAAVGALEAGRLVYSPLNVLYLGATATLLPEAISRLAAGDVRAVVRIGRLASVGLIVGTVLFGVVVALLPASYGRAVLGDRWEAARDVLVPMTVFFVASGASYGTKIRLRAYKAVRRSLMLRVIGAIVLLVLTSIGLLIGTVSAVAWALAGAMVLTMVLWEVSCIRTPEERALRPVADMGSAATSVDGGCV